MYEEIAIKCVIGTTIKISTYELFKKYVYLDIFEKLEIILIKKYSYYSYKLL